MKSRLQNARKEGSSKTSESSHKTAIYCSNTTKQPAYSGQRSPASQNAWSHPKTLGRSHQGLRGEAQPPDPHLDPDANISLRAGQQTFHTTTQTLSQERLRGYSRTRRRFWKDHHGLLTSMSNRFRDIDNMLPEDLQELELTETNEQLHSRRKRKSHPQPHSNGEQQEPSRHSFVLIGNC